jgi:hypothetical protein
MDKKYTDTIQVETSMWNAGVIGLRRSQARAVCKKTLDYVDRLEHFK